MDAVTYPNTKVIEFINNNVVALRVPSDSQPLAGRFNVKWTPVLAVLDQDGVGHQQTLGFFPAEEFIPSIMLGIAKVDFDHDRLEKALAMLHRLQADHAASAVVPQAIFLEGVCRYKHSHEPKTLKDAYEQLHSDFPNSDWTQRAEPYRLL